MKTAAILARDFALILMMGGLIEVAGRTKNFESLLLFEVLIFVATTVAVTLDLANLINQEFK